MQSSTDVPPILPALPWILGLLVTTIVLVGLRRRLTASFYSVVCAALLWGIVLFLFVPPYTNPQLIHSLADAFVIAALLALTVDKYVKRRVLHEVTSDVSKYLIGYRLPEQIQDRLHSIMQTQWIRRAFEVRIRLTEPRTGLVELDLTISDRVQNITSETQEYVDTISFSKFKKFKINEMRCDSDNGAGTYHLNDQQVDRQEESGQVRHFGKRVKIPPAPETDGDFRFSARYTVSHSHSYEETFTFNQSTIGATIEIADCPLGFIFHLSPTPDQAAHQRWTYNRLFLPGEQISIQWEKQLGAAS